MSEDEALLAARMRALAAFAPGYFHDLKGPLNTIVLRLELLRAAPASGEDKRRASVTAIEDQVRRLDRMLQCWLGYSAPGSDANAGVDLRLLANDVGALVAPLARKRRLELAISTPDEPLPSPLPADALSSVLLDLVRHAAVGLDAGGQLSVRLQRDGATARLSVRGGPFDAPATSLAGRVVSAAGGTCVLINDADGSAVALLLPLNS
ncbi:MAG: hypothetical protein ABI629_21300 [bacterium]